ncbi:hypothetical protein MSG28_014853 [Choristoneura fumiferana]|uniref:Uncharacterized protein n=1 Tax=Choristoneura fumiferana TaxID=7141 RepID=A0ACC0JT80_CHOFU|nr:hypothetical protein MSG28_014853 [Choristoneura fumiferana]
MSAERRPLLDIGLPKALHSDRSCAFRIHRDPAILTRSSLHLVGGLPTARLPLLISTTLLMQQHKFGVEIKNTKRLQITNHNQPIYVPLLGTGLLSEQESLGYRSHAGPVRTSHAPLNCFAGPQYEPGGYAAAVQQRSNMTQREDALKFEQGRIKALQEERLHIQKKTFTKWINSFLQKERFPRGLPFATGSGPGAGRRGRRMKFRLYAVFTA